MYYEGALSWKSGKVWVLMCDAQVTNEEWKSVRVNDYCNYVRCGEFANPLFTIEFKAIYVSIAVAIIIWFSKMLNH